jgi:hypothetical protein
MYEYVFDFASTARHKPVTCPDAPTAGSWQLAAGSWQPQLTSSYGLVGPVTRSIAHDVNYVPTGGQTGRRPRLPLLFGKPGDLQVQPPLQLPSGGRGDRAGFEEPGHSAFSAAMRSPYSSRSDMAPGWVSWLRLMRARVFPMRVLV